MKKTLLLLMLAVVGIVSFRFAPAKTEDPNSVNSRDLISKMLSSIDNTKTLQFTLKGWERVEGKDNYSEIDAKLHVNPFKVYILSKAKPNDGVQIIFNQAEYGSKAHVNPGAWLPNVNLDPYGSKMRKGQHHTILNSGFTFLAKIIRAAIAKADKEAAGEFEKHFVYEGDVVWNGRKCYKVVITDPTFKYENYTVKAGETVDVIAKNRNICGYLIVEKNKDVDDFADVSAGQVIQVPTTYAQKTTLYIDQQNHFPVVQIMHDEKGQFERYEFHNLITNPKFNDNIFVDFP